MGYLKNKIIEGMQVNRETSITLERYEKEKDKEKEYTEEEQKKISDMIDCQIEDMKIRRSEKEHEK